MTRPVNRARRILVVVAFVTALFAGASPAGAADTATRTAADIRTRWQQLKPAYTGSPYAVTPSWAAPYATGVVAAGHLQDGLNALNYCRYLAGLPDDVFFDSGYSDKAQHAAVLLAASDFSHSPPKPADMDQTFYDLGLAGTSSSNIGAGYVDLADFIFGGAFDGDAGNIDRVGHRRWLLDPPLLKTGMGSANGYFAAYVFDWSRSGPVEYDTVKWPCAGFFPVEMFGASTPWSITLDPAVYSWTSSTAAECTLTLRRTRDGRTWTFTSADTNRAGEYFNFNRDGYGVSNCFIFRPDPASVGTYQPGDAFTVTLTGGISRRADGSPATISYTTTFISQVALGGLAGTVTSGGVALAGVDVVLSEGAGSALSAPDGTYSIGEVQPGTYSATYSKDGYASVTAAVTIEADKTANRNVSLSPVPATVGTHLSLKASPTALAAYGAATTLTGYLRALSSTGDPVSGQTVYVQTSVNGSTGWKDVKTLVTSPEGYVRWSAVPRATTYYRLRFAGKSGSFYAAASAPVKVVPRAYLSAATGSRYGSRAYHLSGYLKPRHTAGTYPVRVYLWRYVSGRWVLFGYVKARAYDYSSYTRYRVAFHFPYSGRWRMRAYHPADSGQSASYSGYSYLTVW